MKRTFTAFIFFAVLSVIPALAENDKTPRKDDSTDPVTIPLKKEIAKSGWSIGLLPAFQYNNDLGFMGGILSQVFDYGDGTVYPNYRHKFMANVNVYSRGAKQMVLNYDSKYLIPGKRVTAAVSYMDNPLCGFYGFNGAVSPYHADLDMRKSVDGTEGIAFYSTHQRQFSASLDLQGGLADGLTWIGGFNYSWQRFNDVNFRVYDGTESLYHQYLENGLIPESDTFGHRVELKGGLVYDTRDFETNPERGLYASVTTTGGASFSGSAKASLVLSADVRQYIPLWPGHITFAWQAAYKGLLAGSLPFYSLPAFAMRGSFGSRIVGNGVAWASADLRLRIASFQAFKQNIELGLVGFADAGAVVQTHKYAEQTALGACSVTKDLDGEQHGPYASIYDPQIATRERLHTSVGGGFWFAINRNFMTAFELGRPMNTQDGNFGIYINMGFSF
jgi:outer membrane protein assembly factor BamA